MDTSSFSKKENDSANFISADKLEIDKLKNIPTNLSNLKSKIDKSCVDKLYLFLWFWLTKWCSKNDVVKKDLYNVKIKNIEDKMPDITNLATKASLNAKINEVKGGIPSVTNW